MSTAARPYSPAAYQTSIHMPSYKESYRSSYTNPSSNYSSTSGRYGPTYRSTYGSSTLYGHGSSTISNKPPTGPRTLPKGPGPLDKYGNKQSIGEVRSSLLRHRSTTSTNSPTKPIKADHHTGSYGSSALTGGYSTRSSPSTSSYHTKLQRETMSPPSASLRRRTSSTHDLSNNFRNVDIKDVGSSTLPLRKNRTFGSTSDIHSTAPRRSSFDSGCTESQTSRKSNFYTKDYSTETYLSSSSRRPERDDASARERLTANLTPEKIAPIRSRDVAKDKYGESDDDSAYGHSPPRSRRNSVSSDAASPHDSNNNIRSFSDREKSGKIGLSNLGNTCFMNSVLQCLSKTRPLLEFCVGESYKNQINKKTSPMKGALITAYAALMRRMWDVSSKSSVSPTEFKSQIQRFAPRFVGYSQQDAQEFLRYLLQGLHEDINRVQSKPKPITVNEAEEDKLSDSQKGVNSWQRYLNFDSSVIVDIFVGQLKSTLTCTTCGHASVTFDPFWDLSLPIPKKSHSTDILDCLSLFMQEEVLDGDERPKCEKCKTHRKCTKSFSIQKFPKVLVLHLKRFSGERYRSKLSTLVEYPISGLSLTEFAAQRCDSKPVYNLYGVSNHSGSVYSGHYTAYCKHPYSGEWVSVSDAHVRDVSTRNVVSSEGYVLFYELADTQSRL